MSSGSRKHRRPARGAGASKKNTPVAEKKTPPQETEYGSNRWLVLAGVAVLAAGLLAGVVVYLKESGRPETARAAESPLPMQPAPIPTHAPAPQMARVEIPPARPAAEPYAPTTGPEAGYIGGTESCAECHASIVNNYSKIAMGRSVELPNPRNMEEGTTTPEYYHEPSRQYFRVMREGDRYYQERWQLGPRGERINVIRASVDYVMGSGNNARSYIHMGPGGKAYQLPLAWYPQPSKWAMNPGYDHPQHSGFSRRLTFDCIACHAAYPKVEPGLDRTNYADMSLFPHGFEAIDCERCHGPAAKHVELARASAPVEQVRSSIVNPANLDTERQLDVCMQCHLETTSGKLPHATFAEGSRVFGFKPGDKLADSRINFDHPRGVGFDDKFEIAGQAYRMRMSKCFTESHGKMTCTTCHDPHRVPSNRVAAGNMSCMTCHTDTSCKEVHEVRAAVKDSCIECHMPRRRTDDVINVVMTDHYIQRFKPPDEELLAPRKENQRPYKGEVALYYPETPPDDQKDLYLGVAHVTDGADVTRGVEMLTRYLEKFPDSVLALMSREFGYKELGRYADAVSDLLKAARLESDRPQIYTALGDALEHLGNHADAIRAYEEAIKLRPDLITPWNGLGVNRMLLGDVDGAIEAWRKVAELEEFDEDAHLNLASAYGQKGMILEAAESARRALAINPSKSTGWMLLAQCMLAERTTTGPEEAAWYAAEAVRLDPGQPEPFDTLRDAVDAMPPQRQLAALERFERDIPFEAKTLQARVLAGRDDLKEAAEVLEELVPSIPETSYSLVLDTAGDAALLAGRPDLAERFFRHSLQLEGRNEAALVGLAQALSKSGEAGEQEAEKLLTESPILNDSSRALNTLAFLKATARSSAVRDSRIAEELVRRAERLLMRPNVFTLDTLAAAQADQGRYAEAIATIERAVSMAREDKLDALAEMLETRLPVYRANRPLRAGEVPLD